MAAAPSTSSSTPPPLVALAGWLLPGAGYWLIGERVRAVTVGVTILVVFTLGILIAGIRVVQAPDMSGPGNAAQRVNCPYGRDRLWRRVGVTDQVHPRSEGGQRRARADEDSCEAEKPEVHGRENARVEGVDEHTWLAAHAH